MEQAQTEQRAGLASVFEIYWRAVVKHPWLLSGVILTSIALQGAELGAPLFLREFFNALSTQKPSPQVVSGLTLTLALVTLVWLFDWASQYTQSLCNEQLEANVMKDLYKKSFGYLLGHSHSFFTANFAGSLTHKVSRFARSFETLFDSLMMYFLPTALFVGGAIVVLFLRSHTLGLLLAACSFFLLSFQIYLSRRRQSVRGARAEAESKLTGTLADAISNQNTITLFGSAAHEEKLFASAVSNWREATLHSWRSDSSVWSRLNFFMVLVQVAILYGAIIYWQQGALTVGDFVLIQAYLLTTFNRLTGINYQLRRFYDAYADAKEMIGILELPHEIQNVADAPELHITKGEIVFRDVSFYFDKSPVLSQVSFTVRGGEKLAVVGPSGAGKSTITKLLLRLYNVSSGTIAIDGQNISQVTQESLRRSIAFVPQEPILFHRTLLENIRYGRQDATDNEVIEAAKKAHCHEFISQFKDGYGTFVGERGIRLSGGERQRVAIARAILKNAPILVLDEATSSLDSQSEALIQDALETLMQGKTVIVIAHRLSTIMKMDRILVIESGRIAAQGTHAELLAQGGLYRSLWNIQAGGFLPQDNDAPPEPEEEELAELSEEASEEEEDEEEPGMSK